MASSPGLPSTARISRIVVFGSLNIDLVMNVARLPEVGESVRAHAFQTFIGGKGLNQAIACARMGAQVAFVGRIGEDDFGQTLRATAHREGINTTYLLTTPGVGSGVANILVDERGENMLIIAAGANGQLTPQDAVAAESLIASADVLLMQLEIPLETVIAAARIAHRAGVRVVLVSAPAMVLPQELMSNVDVLIANRVEISQVLASPAHDPEIDARRALAMGPRIVLVTLGSRGALLLEADANGVAQDTYPIPTFPITPVDSTGAGDAFAGGFTVAWAAGVSPKDAARQGAACGALACTVMGAEPSLPRREAVAALLAAHPAEC